MKLVTSFTVYYGGYCVLCRKGLPASFISCKLVMSLSQRIPNVTQVKKEILIN